MLTWSLPSGVVWDSQKGNRGNRGIGDVSSSVGDVHVCEINTTGGGNALYGYRDSDTVVSSTVIRVGYPSPWAVGTGFDIDVRFPVQGWTMTTPPQ